MSIKDDYTRLVDDLQAGRLGPIHVQNAYRAWIAESKDVPEGVKDLLNGRENSSSLVVSLFSLLGHIGGSLELAYRRGFQAGQEEAEAEKRRRETGK